MQQYDVQLRAGEDLSHDRSAMRIPVDADTEDEARTKALEKANSLRPTKDDGIRWYVHKVTKLDP